MIYSSFVKEFSYYIRTVNAIFEAKFEKKEIFETKLSFSRQPVVTVFADFFYFWTWQTGFRICILMVAYWITSIGNPKRCDEYTLHNTCENTKVTYYWLSHIWKWEWRYRHNHAWWRHHLGWCPSSDNVTVLGTATVKLPNP